MPDKHFLHDKIQYLGLWNDFFKPKVELSKSVIYLVIVTGRDFIFQNIEVPKWPIFYYCFLAEQFICEKKRSIVIAKISYRGLNGCGTKFSFLLHNDKKLVTLVTLL